MANILKSNSARISLRSITQSLAAASTTTTNHSSSPTYRLSVRFLHSCLDRDYIITPPLNWGVVTVPFPKVFIIERYGKYFKTLPPGMHYLVPFVDRIAYVHSLTIDHIKIPAHPATTKDNVTIIIEGMLRVKIVDPKLASYGVENPLYAVIQLAQTIARRELSKIILDKFFVERDMLYEKILFWIEGHDAGCCLYQFWIEGHSAGCWLYQFVTEKELIMVPSIKWAGNPNVTIAVKVVNLHFFLLPRITLKPLVPSFPCFANIHVALMEKPHVDFGLKLLGADLMSIPGVYRIVQELLKDQMYLWPKNLEVQILDMAKGLRRPVGILHAKVLHAIS